MGGGGGEYIPTYGHPLTAGSYTARPKKKCHSNVVGPPFALIMERICCGVVSTTLCNVTTLIYTSGVVFIFGRDFVLMTGESNDSFSLFQHIPMTFNGVKSGLKSGGQFMCENDSSCSLTLRCPHAPFFFTTRAR